MAGKKAAGENTRKAAGNAKKAEVAAQKEAVGNAKKAQAEDQEWSKGAKDTSKAATAAAKKEEEARKKAEKAALLAEEEASLPSKPTKKPPPKKSKGLDLSGLDAPSSAGTLNSLNATGIDNALDALSLTSGSADKIDRHPERRFKAAYAAFEERRLDEMKDEKGLRRNQKVDQIRKEFEKHPENPFNQVNATYNSTRDDLKDIREQEKGKVERRLGD